jgi:hypothetical protein
MGTNRAFNDMLNQYLPDQIFAEELVKRDYVLGKVEKQNDWKAGSLIVPFRGAWASSVSYSALTSSTDVAESTYVRGSISGPKEIWGTLIFNQRDLMEHDGKIPESTFLRILPDEIEHFMGYLKEVVSTNLVCGPHFAKSVTTDATSGGVLTVDHVDRFTIGQKFILDDDDSNTVTCYVIAVDTSASTVTVSATRGGSALDISAYDIAQNAKCYHPGGTSNSDTFLSMRETLLSSANGGTSTVHGQTKTTYPILQAVNVDGSTVNATNILDKIFDAYTTCRTKAKGNANTVLVSWKHLGSIMKLLEVQKGAYRVTKDASANVYGWTEISIGSVKGDLTIVGLMEMDDDVIFGVDWSSMKFATNNFFKKRTGPDGRQYFEVRNTTGYQYIVDVCLFGEMVYYRPGHNFVIHSISY